MNGRCFVFGSRHGDGPRSIFRNGASLVIREKADDMRTLPVR